MPIDHTDYQTPLPLGDGMPYASWSGQPHTPRNQPVLGAPNLKLPYLSNPIRVLITPAWAAAALDQNKLNRAFKRDRLREYTDAMLAGEWTLTHQGICFYTTGDICDGQNRLAAVVRSGVSVEMFVTYGMPLPAGAAVDRGAPRTQTDAIRISQECPWATPRALALAKMTSTSALVQTDSNMVRRLHEYERSYRFVLDLFTTRRKHVTSVPVLAAAVLAHHHGVPEHVITYMYAVMTTGVMSRASQAPFIKLREFLLRSEHLAIKGADERGHVLRLTQRAIRAVHLRETVKQLRAPAELIWPLFG